MENNRMTLLFPLLFLMTTLVVDASLAPYVSQLQQPPACQECVNIFQNIMDMPVPEEQLARTNAVCSIFPREVYNGNNDFVSKCSNFSASSSAIEHCAKIGVCPSECSYCKSRVVTNFYTAWQSDVNKAEFCHHLAAQYGYDENSCVGRVDDYKTLAADKEDPASDFCEDISYPCNDYDGATYHHQFQVCIDTPVNKQCPNGFVGVEYLQTCSPVKAVDPFSFRLTDEVQEVCFSDPCKRVLECVCGFGFINVDGACVPDPNAVSRDPRDHSSGSLLEVSMQVSSSVSTLIKNAINHRSEHSARSVRREQTNLQAQIELAQKLHKQQLKATVDCNTFEWTYFTDSPVDGITFSVVGASSDHELYCMAFRQDGNVVEIAQNLNLWPDGQAAGPSVVVSQGDFLMNPFKADGSIRTITEAVNDNVLYGIHFDDSNDNSDPLGVYRNAKFHSVTGTNNGFATVSMYIEEIRSMSSTTNPTAGVLQFGAGIDAYDNYGVGYLGEIPYNEMKSGESIFVSSLVGDAEYYTHEDPISYPEDARDLATVENVYKLVWVPNGGTGINTRIIKVPRTAFPAAETKYRIQIAEECYNDVMAGDLTLCALPSASASLSTSVSLTPTSSLSATTTASTSPSASMSSAPSIAPMESGACPCFEFGNDGVQLGQPGVNTLTLGDFRSLSSDTEGRLYVCGDATISDYSVGDKLQLDTSRDDLFVDGNLMFSRGRVHNGNIIYGGQASIGTAVLNGMYDGTISRVNDTSDNWYDCDAASSYFEVLSLRVGAAASTGTVTIEDGDAHLTRGTSGLVEIFDFDCADLSGISRIIFESVPSGQSVIVNFMGPSCYFNNIDIKSLNSNQIVFNFPATSTITVKNTAIEANLLAPYADFTGYGSVVKGQSVVLSWTGNTQQNFETCSACLNV
jgi:choice-of-anchor A domain-containing protein